MADEEIKLRLTFDADTKQFTRGADKTKKGLTQIDKLQRRQKRLTDTITKAQFKQGRIQHKIMHGGLKDLRLNIKAWRQTRQEIDRTSRALQGLSRHRGIGERILGGGRGARMRGAAGGIGRGLFSLPGMLGMYAGGRVASFGVSKFISSNIEAEQTTAKINALLRSKDPAQFAKKGIHGTLAKEARGFGMEATAFSNLAATMLPFMKTGEDWKRTRMMMGRAKIARPDKSEQEISNAFMMAAGGRFTSMMTFGADIKMMQEMRKQGFSITDIVEKGLKGGGVTEATIAAQKKTLGFQMGAIKSFANDALEAIGKQAFTKMAGAGGKGGTMAERFEAFIASKQFTKFAKEASDALARLGQWVMRVLMDLPRAFNWLQEHWETIKSVTKALMTMMIASKVASSLGMMHGKLGMAVMGLTALYAASKMAADWIDKKQRKEISKAGWRESLAGRRAFLEKEVAAGRIKPGVARERMRRSIAGWKKEGIGVKGEEGWMEQALAAIPGGAAFGGAIGKGGEAERAELKKAGQLTFNINVKADNKEQIKQEVNDQLDIALEDKLKQTAAAQ